MSDQNGESLSVDLVERVLARLNFSKRPSPDMNGLRSLYSQWCQRVPFDNARKLIHVQSNNPAPLPGDNATDFFEAWLSYGTGGTCWSGNGALQALLTALGFNASRGVATMLVVPDLPPNHGTVIVDLNGSKYLVDASILHDSPLRIDDHDLETNQTRFKLRLSKRDEKWHIWWQPLHMPLGLECRVDDFPVPQQEFQRRHEMTREWSPFNYELTVRLVRGDRSVGIGKGQWVTLDTEGLATETNMSDAQRLEHLVNDLGFSEEFARKIPRDRPTPPPPGSKTAMEAEKAASARQDQ